MNPLLEWLSGGDLRSDGMSNEVADFVLNNIEVFGDLLQGLDAADDVIRGRAADALEKVSRSRPDILIEFLPKLIGSASQDRLPMVRWHMAMILGHLAFFEERIGEIFHALVELLQDASVFVRSWAIVSLCIVAKQCPRLSSQILDRIAVLQGDESIAVRSKARKAVSLLTHEGAGFPDGWIKSEHLACLR